MSGRLSRLLALSVAVALTFGCASTTFKKDPGSHDCGFRYYRPKPYLLITPVERVWTTAPKDNEKTQFAPTVVKLKLEYLQDFSEEYSVHIRPGVGTNNTKLTYAESGVLLTTDAAVDSDISNFLKAVADLVGTAPKIIPKSRIGAQDDNKMTDTGRAVTVLAHNVPLGLYESVIGPGADGKKRLQGWRYVGFAPLANCAIDLQGDSKAPCGTADLFGLIEIESQYYFRRLGDFAGPPATCFAQP